MGKDLDILQAVKDGDLATLNKLLQKATKQGKNKLIGSTKRPNINFQDGDGMSCLHQAALMSSDQMLHTLLDSGAAPALRDNKGMVALHYAAWQGHGPCVQLLLQRGSPVNEQALQGETPLHLACQHGHLDVVTLLLNQHADPTICNKSLRSSLDLACEHGRTRVVELLLRSNLCQKLLEDSPTDTLDNSRTTCLHLAARNGHTEILQTLLHAGMNINRSTLKGTALHEAATTGRTEAVTLLLEWGIDVNRPNSYDQTALDIVTKSAGSGGAGGKELKRILKEASCAVYARALRDYSNAYDPGSLAFKEGDIITVLEQRTDGIWRGYVVHEGKLAKSGMFPANHVSILDSKAAAMQVSRPGQMYSQVPDLLTRGPPYSSNSCSTTTTTTSGGSDRGSLGSSGTDDSSTYSGGGGGGGYHHQQHHHLQHLQHQQQQLYHHGSPGGGIGFPPPPTSLLAGGNTGAFLPSGRGALSREASGGGDSGFSSSQSLPQYTPSSPAGPPSQLGKSPFPFGPIPGSTVTANGPTTTPNGILTAGGSNNTSNGCLPAEYHQGHGLPSSPYHHHQHGSGEHWMAPGEGFVGAQPQHLAMRVGGGGGGASPARGDSPAHSNRNSAASSDSGRGYSTGGGGHLESKFPHYTNVHQMNNISGGTPQHHYHHHHHHNQHQQQHHHLLHQKQQQQQHPNSNGGTYIPQQHRLSGQSYESGVSSRQSYHSSGSSSVGSLDHLEEQQGGHHLAPGGVVSSINVAQLIQAGVPDTEVLHAWLHDLDFGEYYPLFLQAGYDMPTISRMTPEDLTAIGITKPAHRKRLKSEITRLTIHDGIPDYRPSDLMEWLHLLGLGAYLDTLCGQGYDSLDYVTDITWEDLEEIGIKKLGHQKKIMLAIDRLKRVTTGGRRLSAAVEGGRANSLELLEPPPPAPPMSGRWAGAAGEGAAMLYDAAGARPKKSPSGDSLSTVSSGSSGGEMRSIPIPREDAAGLAGGMPYRHQPDVITMQVKRNVRGGSTSSTSSGGGGGTGGGGPGGYFLQQQPPQQMLQSFQRHPSENDVFSDSAEVQHLDRCRLQGGLGEFESEKHEAELNTNKSYHPSRGGMQGSLRVETGEHIYDTPQISPSSQRAQQHQQQSAGMQKPAGVSFAPTAPGLAGPLHVNTSVVGETGQPQPRSSPAGRGAGKKVPPPPPIRTHSIRTESTSSMEDNGPPGSPARIPSGQPPNVTVSATVQPQAAPVSASTSAATATGVTPPKVAAKPAPPPVMQKPVLHQSPIAANKLQQQQTQQQQQQQQQQRFNPQVNPHSTAATNPSQIGSPKVGPVPQRFAAGATPGAASKVGFQANPSPGIIRPNSQGQSGILIRPKASTAPHPSAPVVPGPQQLRSPLPAKATVVPSAGSVHNQQPSRLVGPSPAATSDSHSQALPSCMKSLSEKFGAMNPKDKSSEKQKEDEDQFPDNVSTDSDDFPPPPPPIAMDIITPKIHNYGIPSSSASSSPRRPGDYGLPHRRDFSHKPQHSQGLGRMVGGSPLAGSNITMSYAEVHHRPDAATSRTAPLHSGPVSKPGPPSVGLKVSSQPGHQAISNTSKLSSQSGLPPSTNSAPAHASSRLQPTPNSSSRDQSQGKERTPEPQHPHPLISSDNRSESTTSFESNSSSSSIDSNTLPFANENVGTIKQRVTAAPEGSNLCNPTAQPGPLGFAASSSLQHAQTQHHHYHHHQQQHQHQQQANSDTKTSLQSSRGIRPPVPTKKPVLSPKPARSEGETTSSSSASSVTAAGSASTEGQQQPWVQRESQPDALHSSTVLNDIDDMLQGLTDELDAALEEEGGS